MRLIVGDRSRAGRLLPLPTTRGLTAPEVASQIAAADPRADVEFVGGEPTLREDLLDLIAVGRPADGSLGLETDGLALTSPDRVATLRAAGLDAVRIRVVAARAAAHDWVMGAPGHCRQVLRAIRASAAGGLRVTVELLVSRPGLSLLEETIAAVAHLGATSISLRPLRVSEVASDDRVALVPRVGLMSGALNSAARQARSLGLAFEVAGVPACLGGDVARSPTAEQGTSHRCGDCVAGCPGLEPGYVGLFGAAELPVAAGGTVVPLVFGHPAPIACPACADVDLPRASSRSVRMRMVASLPALERLRVLGAGSLWHPDARELLREVVRLEASVEVCGDVAPLADWSDDDLFRVRRVAEVHGAFFGPDPERHDAHVGREGAFSASMRALDRLAGLNVPTNAFAVVHHADGLVDWVPFWGDDAAPGPPAFRLSPRGGSLDALSASAQRLPLGPVRDAVERVLPACRRDGELAPEGTRMVSAPRSGIDRFGEWDPCRDAAGCAQAGACPGVPRGWTLEAVR